MVDLPFVSDEKKYADLEVVFLSTSKLNTSKCCATNDLTFQKKNVFPQVALKAVSKISSCFCLLVMFKARVFENVRVIKKKET